MSVRIIKYPERSEWSDLQKRPELDVTHLFDLVQQVLKDIKTEGDSALKKYSKQFDNADLSHFEVTEEEFAEAESLTENSLKEAIRVAHDNIETFHDSQRFHGKKIETTKGVFCWQKSVPVEKVGLYVPGGTAPLFSTVLMLAIPARIAGCKEIVLCSPPNAEGKLHPAILYSARISGVNKVFKLGGIQAVAAMTYGTETVPNVYKIFGPGNQYVVAAKQLVGLKDVAIDMPAGPSEVAIIADETANPEFIAFDFLSQAEHGTDSQSLLITNTERLAGAVKEEIDKQLPLLQRRDLTEKSLQNSKIIVFENDDDIMSFTNSYAPEHLIIQSQNYKELGERVFNAGSVFLGPYTPESAGDYASGTNHTLPTKGYAKMYSGVNLDSFIRKITFQEISKEGLQNLGKTIEVMAEKEFLDAHKKAVSVRLKKIND
jgi:histidinol dehydrogenase